MRIAEGGLFSFGFDIQYPSYNSDGGLSSKVRSIQDPGNIGDLEIFVCSDMISSIQVKLKETNRAWRPITYDNNNAKYWDYHDWSKENGHEPVMFWYGSLIHPHVNMWSGWIYKNKYINSGVEIGYWY